MITRVNLPKTFIALLIIGLFSTKVVTQGVQVGNNSNDSSEPFTQSKSDTLKKNRSDACEGYNIDFTLKAEAEMDKSREENSNSFVEAVDILLDVYKGQEYSKVLNVKLAVLIVVLLLFIFVVISWILFIVNICLCCCKDTGGDKECCINCNLIISFIGLIGFAACCIGMAYFAPQVQDGMGNVFCSLNAVSDDIVNGSVNPTFVGTWPLSKIFTSYISDFDKLRSDHTQNFNDIANLNLKALSTEAYDSIDPYNNEFKDKETKDAEGDSKKPLSVTETLPVLIDAAKTEFKILQDTCTAVHDAAVVGRDQVNNPQFDDVKKSIQDVVKQVDGISNTIHDTFESITSSYNMIDSNYNNGQIAFLVFCFLSLLGSILIFIGLCCYLKKNKCDCPCCCRIIIAVLGLLILLFTIFAFVIGVVTFTTSASCGILKDMGKEEGIDKFVDLFKLEGQMVVILKTCMLEAGSGKLTEVFTDDSGNSVLGGNDSKDMFEELEKLLGVFDEYQKTYDEVKGRTDSVSFEAFNKATEEIRVGVKAVDHANVVAALGSINEYYKCDNKEAFLTQTGCDGRSDTAVDCVVIETGTFTDPGCNNDSSKPPNPDQIFNRLKTYQTETTALIKLMNDKGYLKVENTPNKKYGQTLTAFDTAVTKFNLIKADMDSTIKLIESAQDVAESDCKILRAEIQAIESSLCFKFVPAMYDFMLISLVGVVFFLSFIWHFCCADCCLRMSRNHGDEAVENHKSDNNTNYVGVDGKDFYANN